VAKKYLDDLLSYLRIKQVSYIKLSEYDFKEHVATQISAAPYDPDRSAVLVIDGRIGGVIGELKEGVRKSFKLPGQSAGFEISLSAILEKKSNESNYVPLSKYPSTHQDLTLQVDSETEYQSVKGCIESVLKDTKYQCQVEPLSIFQKEGETTKNVSFRITLSHYERTLNTKEVNSLISKIAATASNKLKAKQV
jgi:phenylalanyl-tRNA synthetase beta subunit